MSRRRVQGRRSRSHAPTRRAALEAVAASRTIGSEEDGAMHVAVCVVNRVRISDGGRGRRGKRRTRRRRRRLDEELHAHLLTPAGESPAPLGLARPAPPTRSSRRTAFPPLRETGLCRLCHYPALPSADHRGGGDRVTALACLRSSQSSQHIAGVTPGGGALWLLWLIRAWRWFSGTPAPINRGASIHHGNVAEAADVRVAAPSARLMARRPGRGGRGYTPDGRRSCRPARPRSPRSC